MIIAETGACALGTQMSGASAFGFSYLLAYSTDSSPFGQDVETQVPFPSVATIVVPPSAGARIAKTAQTDKDYTLLFTSQNASSVEMVTGGLMSNFSSFGPSWDSLTVKPTLAAPGGKILSTYVRCTP